MLGKRFLLRAFSASDVDAKARFNVPPKVQRQGRGPGLISERIAAIDTAECSNFSSGRGIREFENTKPGVIFHVHQGAELQATGSIPE